MAPLADTDLPVEFSPSFAKSHQSLAVFVYPDAGGIIPYVDEKGEASVLTSELATFDFSLAR